MIIELRALNNKLIQRNHVKHFPLTIGRDLENDIIIDDEYVCPKHLVITQDAGEYEITDLKTINGSINKQTGLNFSSLKIEDNSTIVIGQTVIDIYVKEIKIAPTKVLQKESREHQNSHKTVFNTLLGLICLSFILSFLSTLFSALTTSQSNDYSEIIVGSVIETLILVVVNFLWSIPWSLFNRIHSHRAQLYKHMLVFIIFYLIYCVFYLIYFWLYAQFSHVIKTIFLYPIIAISFILLISTHLYLIYPFAKRRIIIAKASLLPSIVYLTFLFWQISAGLTRSDYIPINTYGLPEKLRIVRDQSLSEFIDRTKYLYNKLDEEYKELQE